MGWATQVSPGKFTFTFLLVSWCIPLGELTGNYKTEKPTGTVYKGSLLELRQADKQR